jgi:predicted ATPase/DNA-binding SARP family transcriptional activator
MLVPGGPSGTTALTGVVATVARGWGLLELRLLGDMQVTVGGAVITVVPGRQRLLLARLALAEGRFVQVAQLIDDLWEDRPPDSATNALQVYVSALRKLLGPGAVRTRGRSYALDGAAVIDTAKFRREITAALSAASPAGASAASGALERALGRWTGRPCQDLDDVGFVLAARAGLTDLYLSGMEVWAAARIAQGAGREVVPELRNLAGDHPFREGIHAQLIVALAASGRQVEALAAYEDVRIALAEEFGVDPGGALQAAHAAVLRNELPIPRPEVSAGRPVPRALSNLPVALTSFVGRESEAAEIRESLAGARLVTLTGPGGCGKTRLAINVAGALQERYPDGIWLVELGARTDTDGVQQAVALALGVSEAPADALAATLMEHLRDRDMLVILDNCEHLAWACADLSASILANCPGVRIMATSRTPLGVPGEIEWVVPPLESPDLRRIPPLGRLGEYASVRLFVDRASAVLAGFALTESNAAAVAAICARLAGIPLALELAAARVRALSVTQIAARLDEQLALLSDTARHGPARQRTLRHTMDWSFDLLTSREQVLFARLSVFAGSFSLEAAEEMAADDGDGLDLFSRLVVHSLVAVERDEDFTRYRLLEPLRHYAAQRLADRGESEDIGAWHAAYYLRMAEEAEGNLGGGSGQAAWFRLLEREWDNLLAALRELDERLDMPGVARLVSALWRFFLIQGSLREGRRLLEQALAHASVAGSVRARALRTCGIFMHELSDYEQAAQRYAESLELFRSAGAQKDAAGVLANLGLLAANQSQFGRAAQLMEESLQIRRALNDVLEIALSLDNLGMLALEQGDMPKARGLLEESVEMFRQGHDKMGESVALNNLSRIAMRQGDWDGAVALNRQGLELNRELGGQWSTTYCLQVLGEIAAGKAQMAEAAGLLGAAAMLREYTGEVLSAADETEHQKLLAMIQAALGPAEFERAWSRGRARADADPIAYGLEYASRQSDAINPGQPSHLATS